MIKHGNSVACMDDTHGTNNYDFKLVAIWSLMTMERECLLHGLFQIGLMQ